LLRSESYFKTTILASIVVLFVCSCCYSIKHDTSENYISNNVENYTEAVLKEVELIYFKDQKNRRLSSLVIRAKDLICDTTQSALKVRKELVAVDEMIGFYLFNEEDSINVKRLLEITRRHGFPTLKDSIHQVPSFVVFMHSPDNQIEEVREVILGEFSHGRMSEFERDRILWHLDGRSFDGFPQGGVGIRFYTDKEVFEYLTKTGKEKFYPPR
jgi:hypothetical protein